MDLIAIDIQRERDAGLGTLNQTRQAWGLKPYTSFAELTSDPVLQSSYQSQYGTIDNVDLFMGGLAETPAPGAIVGPIFQRIIAAQFSWLRDGDRFFWLNQGFDPKTAAMIANTRLSDIILRNTDTTSIQPDVFVESPATHVKTHVNPTPPGTGTGTGQGNGGSTPPPPPPPPGQNEVANTPPPPPPMRPGH
jgi:hypothetical protein